MRNGLKDTDRKTFNELMTSIKDSVSRIFEFADTEEDVCRLEKIIYHEIMYLAALAQSAKVEPPEGWDSLRR